MTLTLTLLTQTLILNKMTYKMTLPLSSLMATIIVTKIKPLT